MIKNMHTHTKKNDLFFQKKKEGKKKTKNKKQKNKNKKKTSTGFENLKIEKNITLL